MLCIALTALVGLIALTIDVATSTSFINFGAFTAFTMVNVSVVAYYLRQRRQGVTLNPTTYVVLPVLGALVDLYLLTRLDSTAIGLGLAWLAVGVVYLAVLTKGFRVAPPEVEFSEDADTDSHARASR